jgi:G3E family GTPase
LKEFTQFVIYGITKTNCDEFPKWIDDSMRQTIVTPTNLITGFLGVGKTTALVELLRNRPTGSRWAVLVNEYGEVAIDQTILAEINSPEVTIKEVAGGCICCTSAIFFKFALAQILSHIRPERLLIETTGVGHPARLLDMLQHPTYEGRVTLRSTVCLVDPSDFLNSEMKSSPIFLDQVQLADILLLNKADLADQETISEFLTWGRSLFPPKLHVGVTQFGHLEPEWLDLDAVPQRTPLFPDAHQEQDYSHDDEPHAIPLPLSKTPYRKESSGLGHRACGWIFSPEDIFDEGKLLGVLSSHPEIRRLKGVFHTDTGWILVNRVHQDVEVKPTYYRRDSRLEAFWDSLPGGWEAFEKRLMECLVGNPK